MFSLRVSCSDITEKDVFFGLDDGHWCIIFGVHNGSLFRLYFLFIKHITLRHAPIIAVVVQDLFRRLFHNGMSCFDILNLFSGLNHYNFLFNWLGLIEIQFLKVTETKTYY